MPASTRIFASGALTFGGQPVINDLISAGYSTVIVWSVHVSPEGNLFLNDTQIVSGGVYKEMTPMNLPPRIAQLRKAGIEIIFSVGAGGTCDFTSIKTLLGGQTGGAGNVIYDNFYALKQAMKDAGGDIDAIDFDNEDKLESGVMINFANTLQKIGYGHVTFCPYRGEQIWYDTMKSLVGTHGASFVNAIHLQCYDGGSGNADPTVLLDWVKGFKAVGGNALMIAGLATGQKEFGTWWYKCDPSECVQKVPNVAMYQGADWSNYLYTQNFVTPEAALWKAPPSATFMFYCRQPIALTNGRSFKTGDAVYFTGTPWWGSAPQCDAYYIGGDCTDPYNPSGVGICPSNLEAQYKKWGNKLVDGGFIWLYDSIVSGLLSCCGGTVQQPVATSVAYRNAITNGLR
jgi:hypothetical protein